MITLTTDFGTGSPYVASMKGVIYSINPQAMLVDLTHEIGHQDVRHGAQVLAEVCPRFPPGTLHVAVVDPGVGTSRKIIYLEMGDQRFLAPDNGLLSLLARRAPPRTIRAVTDKTHWLTPVSATFHGRDILAPVAACLSLGLSPDCLGPALHQFVELDWPEALVAPGKIEGQVTEVDTFGNLITNITAEMLAQAPANGDVRIQCGDHETFGVFRTYADQPEMTLIALIGSSGKLELAIVGDSAEIMLGERAGAKVTVSWPVN